MNAYRIHEASGNGIILRPDENRAGLYVLFAVGMISLALFAGGWYGFIRYPFHLLYLFLGMGLIFSSGAFIFLIRKTPSGIHIDGDSKNVVFIEGGSRYPLPFSGFSGISLSRKTHFESGPRIIEQLHLRHLNGDILLFQSDSREPLNQAVGKISQVLDLDIYDQGMLIKKGKTTYAPTESILPGSSHPSVTIITTPRSTTYRWNGRKSILTPVLLAVIITGFNVLIFKLALPSLNPGAFLGALIIIPLNLIVAAIFLFSLFGIHIVSVSSGLLSYKQRFLGLNLSNKSFTSGEIAAIQCGFTGDENSIMVLGPRVLEIRKELEQLTASGAFLDKQSAFSLIPLIMEIKNNSIIIDSSALHFHEKLYLVSEWTDRLGLNTAQNPRD